MKFHQALRFEPVNQVAFVGAGGKTTIIFHLARELYTPVIVTTTTHLATAQAELADRSWIISDVEQLQNCLKDIRKDQLNLFTGLKVSEDRLSNLPEDCLQILSQYCRENEFSLLIEADGSRRLPLKAPAEHEPNIPSFVDTVVLVAGLSGIGTPLSPGHVHRPEIFSKLSGLPMDAQVDEDSLIIVVTHPAGGLKNIPESARKVLVLNQADTQQLQAQAARMAKKCFRSFNSVLIASNQNEDEIGPVLACYEPEAAVILAAGAAKRFGGSKLIMEYEGIPLVRRSALTALSAGCDPVVIVVRPKDKILVNAVQDLPIKIVINPEWESGQSSSLRMGLEQVPSGCGSVIFLLADQPFITADLIIKLEERHRERLSDIIAPQVDGKRGNPVLFDRRLFSELKELSGDTGGRVLFSKYKIDWVPWNDSSILVDIDTPEDYQKLIHGGFR
jgi:molybdenum cofactor cytidylyltransferase